MFEVHRDSSDNIDTKHEYHDLKEGARLNKRLDDRHDALSKGKSLVGLEDVEYVHPLYSTRRQTASHQISIKVSISNVIRQQHLQADR